MYTLLGIFTSLLMFSIIVLFHELGHFKAARFFGVKVDEFGLGIPPRFKKLWTDKKGTIYSLNILPIGGFVKLKGEHADTFLIYGKNQKRLGVKEIIDHIQNKIEIFDKNGDKIPGIDQQQILKRIEQAKEPNNLFNKPYWQQSIIILAGVFMNFVLAIAIFTALFFVGTKPIGINDKIPTNLDIKIIPTLEQSIKDGLIIEKKGLKLFPIKGSIALKSGLLENDTVLKINQLPTTSPENFISIMSQNKLTEVSLTIERETKTIEIKVIPDEKGKIGSYVGKNLELNETFKYKFPFLESVKMGTIETLNESVLTLVALTTMIKSIIHPKTEQERTEAIGNMSGPIGIVNIVTQSLSKGLSLIFILGAIISINLGVFNLLPIPALDGGRFLFILINATSGKIFGKKGISLKLETYIHALFFLTLIALSIIIGYNDIIKMFR